MRIWPWSALADLRRRLNAVRASLAVMSDAFEHEHRSCVELQARVKTLKVAAQGEDRRVALAHTDAAIQRHRVARLLEAAGGAE